MMSIGERIKSARIMAGQSQRDLADLAGVSPMAISKYERDLDIPSSSVLLRLAKAFGVKFEYFFRTITVTLSEPTYQRKALLPSEQQASILQQVQEWLERYLDIEMLLDCVPPYSLPSKKAVSTFDAIEDVALDLRKQWNLGFDAIEELIEICEIQGIKIGLIDGYPAFDALTLWANGTTPVIALCRNMPGDQQRFCIARELGHLLLNPAQDLDAEKAAHRFAGAFLVPCSTVKLELGPKRHIVSLYELHLLKHKYGLSMQAWLYRAKDLSILSEADAAQLFKHFRQHNWYKEEPGDALPQEESQRFKRLVIHALCEEVISQARAAELLGVPLSQFLSGEMARHGDLPVELCG